HQLHDGRARRRRRHDDAEGPLEEAGRPQHRGVRPEPLPRGAGPARPALARDRVLMHDIDPSRIEKTPAFVVSTAALEKNLELLSRVQREAGCKILLALKGFSLFAAAEQIRRHLPGVAASGAYEARLGREEFRGEVHTYCAAFGEADFLETLELSDHVIFNSFEQWERFRPVYERFHRETGKT